MSKGLGHTLLAGLGVALGPIAGAGLATVITLASPDSGPVLIAEAVAFGIAGTFATWALVLGVALNWPPKTLARRNRVRSDDRGPRSGRGRCCHCCHCCRPPRLTSRVSGARC
ncbi:hypothetical protein [Streptomyces tendae]|uniref:hypothetical protein n=1 Tax=Streptomyces tendae TaxID=1932 RepID=UPI003EBC542B